MNTTTTTKFFKYDVMNNTIIGSSANIKKAGDPSTPQYKELRALKMKEPTFTVAVREITKSKQKQTYSGLTIEMMKTFVEGRNDEAALNIFNALCAETTYPIIKSWFISNYKGIYKKTETKKAATRVKIARMTNKNNIVPLPADKVEAEKTQKGA